MRATKTELHRQLAYATDKIQQLRDENARLRQKLRTYGDKEERPVI